MVEIDLDAIRARADAATARPWHQAEGAAHVVDLDSEAFFVHHDDRRAAAPDECADAEFIAHARSDIPALLDEVARLQGHCMGREGALRILGKQIEEFRADIARLRRELAQTRDERDAARFEVQSVRHGANFDHRRQVAERDAARELLAVIWLYVDWRYVTGQLTTEQKDRWADIVDAAGDPDDDSWSGADRWWHDARV